MISRKEQEDTAKLDMLKDILEKKTYQIMKLNLLKI